MAVELDNDPVGGTGLARGPAGEPDAWRRSTTCPCRPPERSLAHHDRLRRVEADLDELVELLELAVTWSELDYSAQDLVPPEAWVTFARAHPWADPDRAERLFGLAADIALRDSSAPPPSSLRLLRWITDRDVVVGDL